MSHPPTAREYSFPKIGSYNHLTLQEKKVEQPRANEVLVKVHAVSLQFRDLAIAKGVYPIAPAGGLVPCSDMAGEVIVVGEDVKDWKTGDRVCANFSSDHIHGDTDPEIIKTSMGGQSPGVLTEYRTFPAHSLVSIPEHLSYEEASTLPCAALTAYAALNGPVAVKAGDTVLVLGTGGVSIFALQLAIAAGATVIATSSSDEKLKIASKLGAKHVVNYKITPDWDEEVLKLTNGRGVDHVIEVGGQGTLPKSMNAVRVAGSVHIIGHVAQNDGVHDIIGRSIGKVITLRGIYIGSVAQFKAMNRLIVANPEKTKPVIDKVFPFEEASAAYAHLESQAHVGKVVIKVSKD
ncbi:alcohol dehydrogenase superfamily protein [Crucibulum laeve]|uniref:Alcohol dehydrogenase superfamily protein n=1 Tax=Crucibulum laeve TaxID=68775 RepID=A0A5C3LVY0_9AGAR|nr:alcohol dehydrogenase superfamily protein [Crucibulum laeve]